MDDQRTSNTCCCYGHWSLIIVSDVVAGELSLCMTNERRTRVATYGQLSLIIVSDVIAGELSLDGQYERQMC